ncbi:DNA gyrase inhibitor YacG [Roseovarius albus]|uniref:DNA gyrase inhibitor YacG n=1 Tax=Roseovarius albus TaxID=1247867 RepID=A0A1X6ZEI4_9RHOB|nr:DNA gyrase inhibitor YacG [Roseovarius albus]SLN49014.1 DNA gyrase inhibitor YacG [Roseovarius albus]
MSCPICGKDTEQKVRPFCSKRCADVDLGRWMSGDYALPSQDPEDAERVVEELSKQNARPH